MAVVVNWGLWSAWLFRQIRGPLKGSYRAPSKGLGLI